MADVDWTEVAVAAVGALLGGGGLVWRWLTRASAETSEPDEATAAADEETSVLLGPAHAILGDLVAETSAVRALLLMTDRGPAALTEADPPRITVVAEVRGEGVRRVRDDWQDRQADPGYVAVLRALVAGRELEVVRDDLPDCELRRVYEADGIAASRVRLIGTTEGGIWYLSLGYPHADPLPSIEVVALDTQAAALRALVAP